MSTSSSNNGNEADAAPPSSSALSSSRSGTTTTTTSSTKLFHSMAAHPWPYMVLLPLILGLLAGFGWTQDDIIEDEVTNIWIPKSGSYAADTNYAKSLGRDDLGSTSFAAMAISRDGGNIFTEERLEEVRARMQQAEGATIEYKGNTYNWQDFCSSNLGFPYQFSCARLSPMDLFQEAHWYMDYNGPDSVNSDPTSVLPAAKQDLYRRTWYNELIQKLLVAPRIPRFGILTSDTCAPTCAALLVYRLTPGQEGYAPFNLFADIGNLEMSDPCRICIEQGYEGTINQFNSLVNPAFGVIALEMQRFASNTNNTDAQALAQGIAAKAGMLSQTLTVNDVKEFFFYYVTRGVYAQLGAGQYITNFAKLNSTIESCKEGAAEGAPFTCPESSTVTMAEATAALLRHADNTFSSVTTAGSPLPLWSEGNGTGHMFFGDMPVGGSGIAMSAELGSVAAYLNVTHYGQPAWAPLYGADGFADPTSPLWDALVEKDPMYAWFMAGVTPLTDQDEQLSCGNGNLTGTATGDAATDQSTAGLAELLLTSKWCTKYNVPNTDNSGDGPYTKQHFARMWYNLLIDSDSFLGLEEGVADPYKWTTGQGCGYRLRGERDKYTGMNETTILTQASRELYFIDEGEAVGVISPELLIGDVSPSIGDYNMSNPLEEVGVIQTLYPALRPIDIVQRVRNCNRPEGPINLTEEEAEDLLFAWKEAMENAWTQGWDDKDAGEVQFVAFFDDGAVVGTTGRMLEDITLDNNVLTTISILLIALFSALFLCSWNLVESRVLVTLVGVALVVLAFFGALGFALLIGVKISVTIAWTLPFIILGLGVDDMYIVLMALKNQGGYSEADYLRAMKEVLVPVTMTSLVNASMFAILNLSDIPAIYLTAQVADYCVIALYLTIIFCFPAYCYLDMKRQAAGKRDVFFCCDSKRPPTAPSKADFRSIWLYDRFYLPVVLGKRGVRMVSHLVIWLIAAGLFGTGAYGITQREVGLGLEDFFPSNNQASVWATKRTESLASWNIGINWGALNYSDSDTQLKMIKQFEDVLETPHIAQADTQRLWLADFILWTTEMCSENFSREDFGTLECGMDQVFSTDESGSATSCSGTWKKNEFNLREKIFSDFDDPVCYPYSGGICRPGDRLHPADQARLGIDPVLNKDDVYCPSIDGWSDEQWQFCLRSWRSLTEFSGGSFVLNEERGSAKDCEGTFNLDENFTWPMPYSAGPSMFAFDLFSHDDTLEMMEQTRSICDDDEELHCWLIGIPYDYWSQYENIFDVLVELAGYSTAVGFLISFIFLLVKFQIEKRHSNSKIFCGSLIGALLIATTIMLSLVSVVGLSILAGVSLTGFSNMSFVLSVGFAVEYSVHIVARWLRASTAHQTGVERVRFTMSFLMLPTFMSFVSSTIGVVCLAFTEFEFNQVFFFRPLIIVMVVTYFFGCWWLPAMLTLLDFDVVKLGKAGVDTSESNVVAPKVLMETPEGPKVDIQQEGSDRDYAHPEKLCPSKSFEEHQHAAI